MQATLRAALIGLMAVALAACGGSGGGGIGNGEAGKFAACPDASSGPCQDDTPRPPEATPAPQCSDDTQCPPLRLACSVCVDGTSACPNSVCKGGQCIVVMPTCPEPTTCGGIAGLPCADGYVCEDDPNDACAPESGVDCTGVCVPDKKPQFCGGIAGFPCPDGYECVDDPSDDCSPAKGGADCGGICQPITKPECARNDECPQLRARCSECPDGTAACPESICANGQCTVVFPTCPQSPACGGIAGTACKPGYECVDDPSDNCDPANGGADCGGLCQPVEFRQCTTDAECPFIGAPCIRCADGTAACPESLCVNGQCNVVFPTCASPNACGGIAGWVCKPGYDCVDTPGDDCDPSTGADCPGICVPTPPPGPPRCAGFTGETCPEGFECVDDPSDDCDPKNGGADCGGLCQPAETRQCKTDAECPIIGAPCSICADGTYVCPRSFCKDGQCAGVIESCSAPLP